MPRFSMPLDPAYIEERKPLGPETLDTEYLYHGFRWDDSKYEMLEKFEGILRNGLMPRGETGVATDWDDTLLSRPGHVYLALPSKLVEMRIIPVVRIHVNQLDPRMIDTDEDVLLSDNHPQVDRPTPQHYELPDLGFDGLADYYERQWKHLDDSPEWSLFYEGTIAYRGRIPIESLEVNTYMLNWLQDLVGRDPSYQEELETRMQNAGGFFHMPINDPYGNWSPKRERLLEDPDVDFEEDGFPKKRRRAAVTETLDEAIQRSDQRFLELIEDEMRAWQMAGDQTKPPEWGRHRIVYFYKDHVRKVPRNSKGWQANWTEEQEANALKGKGGLPMAESHLDGMTLVMERIDPMSREEALKLTADPAFSWINGVDRNQVGRKGDKVVVYDL